MSTHTTCLTNSCDLANPSRTTLTAHNTAFMSMISSNCALCGNSYVNVTMKPWISRLALPYPSVTSYDTRQNTSELLLRTTRTNHLPTSDIPRPYQHPQWDPRVDKTDLKNMFPHPLPWFGAITIPHPLILIRTIPETMTTPLWKEAIPSHLADHPSMAEDKQEEEEVDVDLHQLPAWLHMPTHLTRVSTPHTPPLNPTITCLRQHPPDHMPNPTRTVLPNPAHQ